MKRRFLTALALGAGLLGAGAQAQQMMMTMDAGPKGQAMAQGGHGGVHAPMGVMGAHLMPKGKVMLGYGFGAMGMSGNRIGTSRVSPDYIATSVPNAFFGAPGQPPTLRVVPTEMDMQMHMFGIMYAPGDRVTLMAMLPYIEKSMSALTYAGPAGTAIRGRNKMSSEGIGDAVVGATIGLKTQGRDKLLLNLGLSLPTGSITETDRMLTPMGTTPIRRMAYPMHLGSGTFDLRPALTWTSHRGPVGWGAQMRGILRLGSNDEGYSLGDEVALAAWASYRAAPWVTLNGRIEARRLGRIDGRDPLIGGPMQGADPARQGGDTITLHAGADFMLRDGPLKGHRMGIDIGLPVYQDLNSPQLGTDWKLAIAWRKGF